mmetsp:Transcript_24085/g.56017  ORF Transcript_24085/g.56017 Transcript_24085/m.56017 type:complete len:490 (+) Transcript_24085:116-1585(+)
MSTEGMVMIDMPCGLKHGLHRILPNDDAEEQHYFIKAPAVVRKKTGATKRQVVEFIPVAPSHLEAKILEPIARETKRKRVEAKMILDPVQPKERRKIDTMRAEAEVVVDPVQPTQRAELLPPVHLNAKAADPEQLSTPVDIPAHLAAKIVDPKSFKDVPIIDLSQPDSTVIEQLRYACTVVGFMQVIGHGIPEELEKRHMRMLKTFFSLPTEKKEALRADASSPVRGFYHKGGENLDKVVADKSIVQESRKVTDNKEGLDLNGVPWVKQPGDGYISRIFGTVQGVPGDDIISGFADTIAEYQQAVFKLAMRILRLFALLLGKEGNFFEQHMTAPVCTHRMLHYWQVRDFQKEIGTGEHTDYGLITILKQDNIGGLQVLNAADRQWVHAMPVEGAFVVNIGDMMARWTGHYFKSTVHRVVNGSPEDRFSSPYFVEPNLATQVTPGALWPGPRKDESDMTCEQYLDFFYTQSGMLKPEEKLAFERGELQLR